jgi:hypothetical protein
VRCGEAMAAAVAEVRREAADEAHLGGLNPYGESARCRHR